jgi:hypothetical protein
LNPSFCHAVYTCMPHCCVASQHNQGMLQRLGAFLRANACALAACRDTPSVPTGTHTCRACLCFLCCLLVPKHEPILRLMNCCLPAARPKKQLCVLCGCVSYFRTTRRRLWRRALAVRGTAGAQLNGLRQARAPLCPAERGGPHGESKAGFAPPSLHDTLTWLACDDQRDLISLVDGQRPCVLRTSQPTSEESPSASPAAAPPLRTCSTALLCGSPSMGSGAC